jgi:hypothetical protein
MYVVNIFIVAIDHKKGTYKQKKQDLPKLLFVNKKQINKMMACNLQQ